MLFGGTGAVRYLKQAASSGNPDAKQTAVHALSAIANSGTTPDSRLASQTLSNVTFCDDLKAYTGAAVSNFHLLTGRADPDAGGDGFLAKRGIGGFENCTVWIYRDKSLSPSTSCDALEADLDAIRNSIRACLGPNWSVTSRENMETREGRTTAEGRSTAEKSYKFEGANGVTVRAAQRHNRRAELWVDSPSKDK